MGRTAVAMTVAMWAFPTAILINHVVPDPYMDEIFHIPQAQRYCRGDFRNWDRMITTPPGLYIFSLAYVAALYPGMMFLKCVSSLFELCSTPVLRSTNATLAVICSILTYDIIVHLKPTLCERRATIYSIAISLYPLHWFFTFLYYTDVASVVTVLAMYLACLKHKYWTSAMFGAISVFMRQTNIIWMLFVAAIAVTEYKEISCEESHSLSDLEKKVIKENAKQLNKISMQDANLRRRRYLDAQSSKPPINGETSLPSSGFLDEVRGIFLKMWCLKWKILVTFWPFILVALAFACFVIWNGSIVLGAKDAHTMSLHFAQLMYFGLVSATVIAPMHFSTSNFISLYRIISKNGTLGLSLWLTALVVGLAFVHFFSIAHPYLLADNRHYTFYIWRKIVNVHWSTKYLLVPLYVYSWFSILISLGKAQKKIWVMLFFLACAAALVPAPLIEFRYYTVPIFFLFFHSPINGDIPWLLMASSYAVVNLFTLAIFLFHPFYWDHEPGTQRFIW